MALFSSNRSDVTSFHVPKYDVFISFRGEETRYNFTSHLHDAFNRNKIVTYVDYSLEKGDVVCSSLVKTIEDSALFLVIFSENYASSTWCLNELTKILEFTKDQRQVTIPVFYKIDPSHVRKQTGSYQIAFANYEQSNHKLQVQKWRTALTEASILSGLHCDPERNEAEFIKEIVECVKSKLGYDTYQSELPENLSKNEVLEEFDASEWTIRKIPSSIDDMTIYKPHTKRKDQNPAPMAPSVQRKWKFHAFLSFIGQDTATKFTDHLYVAFRERGMIVFKEDTKVEREQNISPNPETLEAIEDSLYVIVVLSKNYAFSAWHLDKLQKALESRKKLGRQVFPVFYGVDPSEVRNQKGSFAKAFARHEAIFDRDKVQRWRDALTEIADLSSWDSKHVNEELVEDIVGSIWNKLLSETSSWDSEHQKEEEPVDFDDVERAEAELASSDPSNVIGIDSGVASNYLDNSVGIRSRVDEMMSKLTDSDDVCFIGIWGMPGIGKTTLVRAVYDQISNYFPYHYFYDNVREASRRNGHVGLQRVLLSGLQRKSMGSLRIHNTHEGKNILKGFCLERKVLIVLDDVNDTSQLKNLAETPQWFGAGSRIIITTRDKSLLTSHEMPLVHDIKVMNYDESLQLFSRNAFKRDYPDENYSSLSQSVVQYAGGLPLALEVLGKNLFGRSIPEWREALVEWKQHQDERISGTLKISYEELTEENKKIFLFIACFLGVCKKDKMTQVLKNYGVDDQIIEHGLRVLIDKALIIEEENCLEMHSLLQQLGKSIVLEEKIDLQFQRCNTGPYGVHRLYRIAIENEWRIVGIVSSVVGVVTYAQSSSFNLLWGEWKWWTTFLYCSFSFIVCGVVSIAPKLSQLQVLRRLWARRLLTSMILMLTALHAFYYDKLVAKKPDALSMISSSALVLMSISLSKQADLGFESALSPFWLGLMTDQLTKNW